MEANGVVAVATREIDDERDLPRADDVDDAGIARGSYRSKDDRAIRGSGYVVASLEAALWGFDRTDSYDAAVLRAANLGDDADTTAAVCGQVAGAYYGVQGIRGDWLQKLAMRAEIGALALKLFDLAGAE